MSGLCTCCRLGRVIATRVQVRKLLAMCRRIFNTKSIVGRTCTCIQTIDDIVRTYYIIYDTDVLDGQTRLT